MMAEVWRVVREGRPSCDDFAVPAAGIEKIAPDRRRELPSPTAQKAKSPSRWTGLVPMAACEAIKSHLEREKRLELSTYTLARYRSTN
jgi:hypothetical protein